MIKGLLFLAIVAISTWIIIDPHDQREVEQEIKEEKAKAAAEKALDEFRRRSDHIKED